MSTIRTYFGKKTYNSGSLKGLLVKAASLITHVQQAESSIIWYLSFTRSFFEKLPQSLDVERGVSVYGRLALQNRMNRNNNGQRLHVFFVFKMQKQLRNIVWSQVFVLVRQQLEKYLYS